MLWPVLLEVSQQRALIDGTEVEGLGVALEGAVYVCDTSLFVACIAALMEYSLGVLEK